MTYYYIWILIFAVIAYTIIVDPNVSRYIVLLIDLLKVNLQRLKWMIILHPNNFITSYLMNRKLDKIAKQLTKEQNSDKID